MAEEPAQQPEMWITQGPPDDRPPGGPPHGSPPRGPGHGWGRWIAIVAGFAVLVAVIAVQHLLSGATGRGAEPTTGVSITPPLTTSPPETRGSAPPMTGTSEDSGSSESAYLQTGTGHGGPYIVSTAAPLPAAPVTTTAEPADVGAHAFELVGLAWDGEPGSAAAVVDYHSDSGKLVRTDFPQLDSNGPLSFVVTTDAAIIRPIDRVDGYVVPTGRPAQVAQGLLSGGGQVFPSGDPSRVWMDAADGGRFTFEMVGSDGKATGTALQSSSALGSQGGMLTRDGDGGVLAAGIGGIYDLGPGGVALVTHGEVLAAGPTGFLLYECSTAYDCGAFVLNRATGKRTPLPGDRPDSSTIGGPVQGVLSPDGRYAALIAYASDGAQIDLVDLRTGRSTLVGRSPSRSAAVYGDASSILAFTPDSRALLMAERGGVGAVDVATGKIGSLPLPPLAALAVRPAR